MCVVASWWTLGVLLFLVTNKKQQVASSAASKQPKKTGSVSRRGVTTIDDACLISSDAPCDVVTQVEHIMFGFPLCLGAFCVCDTDMFVTLVAF